MNDLISRQALCEYALNQKDKSVTPNDIMRFPSAQPELDEWCPDCKEYDSKRHCCPRLNRVIRQMVKDAQPERKKGRWLDSQGKEKYVGYYAECSACGGWSEYITDFCPNCGARMDGGDEECS